MASELTARIGWTGHLVELVGQAGAAAARVAGADPASRASVARDARRQAARLSARLDASPLTDATADQVDAREDAGLPPVEAAPAPDPPTLVDPVGGWARALRLEGMATQEVAAVEYANLLACADLEPEIAPLLLESPVRALRRLHAVICRGLLDADRLGTPRRTAQAIHDGGQGKVVYHAPDPETVPGLLLDLDRWLTTTSASLPPVVVAGVLQERLLEWQPFEAANGRLARAAARCVLRVHGTDPEATAVPERLLAADPAGYHAEVAATQRRRGDLGLWLERYVEAVVDGLEHAARVADPRSSPTPPPRASMVLRTLPAGAAITVREYAERAGTTPAAARADLHLLVRAGQLASEPRTRGLRYRRSAPA